MNIINLYHAGVPCIVPRNDDGQLYQRKDIFYFNPKNIVRHEPGGAVITPPLIYAPSIFVDTEAITYLSQPTFSLEHFSSNLVSFLLKKRIILDENPFLSGYRESTVSASGLPVQALFDVTSFCNCNCLTCYHALDLGSYVPPLKDLFERVRMLKALGLQSFEVTGGEPFSRPDLFYILNFIDESELNFYVVTNGSYLKDSSSDLIQVLKRGLGVAISLDGVGNTHDRFRKHRGLYAKVIAGLEVLHNQGIKIYLVSTLTEENIFDAEELVRIANQYQAAISFRPATRVKTISANNLKVQDWQARLKDLLSLPGVRSGLISANKTMPPSKYYGCGLRKKISIDSYGNIYPCVMDRQKFLKNLNEYTPTSLVSDLEKETRIFLEANRQCRECEYNKKEIRCGGFCRFSKGYIKESG